MKFTLEVITQTPHFRHSVYKKEERRHIGNSERDDQSGAGEKDTTSLGQNTSGEEIFWIR